MNHSNLLLIVSLWLVLGVATVTGQHTSPLFPTQLTLPDSSYTISFEWYGDSLGSVWEPYAALLLPVKIPGYSPGLYMQFDLGAPNSMFYRKELAAVLKQSGRGFEIPDSAQALKYFTFQIGQMPVTAKSIQVMHFENMQIDRTVPSGMQIIGTIGADFIDDRVVMIDYPRKRIVNAQAKEALNIQSEMSEFTLIGRKVLLPAIVNDTRTMLYFDTGSSAFELLTDKENFERMALPGALPVQYPVSSWGRTLTAHTIQTADSLGIGSSLIPIGHVTYMEGVSARQADQMKKIGIGGMIGNKLFLKKRLLLDARLRKFAVLEPSN